MVDTGNPLGHFAASTETELRHPVEPEDPPAYYRRNQLIAVAIFIGLIVLGTMFWH